MDNELKLTLTLTQTLTQSSNLQIVKSPNKQLNNFDSDFALDLKLVTCNS
jgi:hypothetical protein